MPFRKGRSGNPAGRRPGSRNRLTLARASLFAEMVKLRPEAAGEAARLLRVRSRWWQKSIAEAMGSETEFVLRESEKGRI
jgi:uncharacterized protein DUF5681